MSAQTAQSSFQGLVQTGVWHWGAWPMGAVWAVRAELGGGGWDVSPL